MTWTVAHLRKWIEGRGDKAPQEMWVQEALLAHERFRGRTDENYSKHKAERELHRLLEGRESEFPRARDGEYKGMTQLRAYVRDREKVQEEARNKQAHVAKYGYDQEEENEYER